MKNSKGIILLSGGLDSVVSVAVLNEEVDFEFALFFDYGQKSFEKELIASKKVAEHYGVKHETIKLDWLKELSDPQKVWIPNRNGLFINIAAAYADSKGIDYIVIGANKEEAANFSDNSKQFIEDINKSLETSTQNEIKVLAPFIDSDKNEIVKTAIELNVPLNFINSCYNNTAKHCGVCESCNRLKRALQNLHREDLIRELFE